MNQDETRAILARIITSIVFGIAFVFSKTALSYVTPIELLSYRFFAAALLMYLLYCLNIIKITIRISEIKPLLIISIFQPILGYYFEMLGLQRISAAEAGIVLALIPIMVTVTAVPFLKEKPNSKQVFFLIGSFIGVTFILFIRNGPFSAPGFLGSVFLIIGATGSAIHNILTRKISAKYSAVDITFTMMLSGAVFFGLANLAYNLIHHSMDRYFVLLDNPEVFIPVIYLGAFASVIGFLLTNYSLSKMTAMRVAIFNNLATVISIMAGVLIMGDHFSKLQITGAILIILGVWGVNYYGRKPLPAVPDSIA